MGATTELQLAEPEIRLFRGNQFIQIAVRHARTHIDEGRAQYTDYEIELKTNHIAFTIKYSKVRRRYSDFVWLRNRMVKDAQPSTPPTLPGKRLFGRFNRDFIKQRQRKLQDFLFGLVQSNVYLSHAALHLFLQSKLSVEDIDHYLDGGEEDAAETILAESECRARLIGCTERRPSKHDSGFSGDFGWTSDCDWLADIHTDVEEAESAVANYGVDVDVGYEDVFSDGNAADVESEDETGIDVDSVKADDSDEDADVTEEMNRLRIGSLPAEPLSSPSGKDELESSVEYLLSENSTESECSSRPSTRSTRGSSADFSKCRLSSQENLRNTPRKRSKRKYSRFSRDGRAKSFTSQSSLPEFGNEISTEQSSPTLRRLAGSNLRRALSFHDQRYATSSFTSSLQNVTRVDSHDNCCVSSRRLRRSASSLYNERTPIKRKISLNEYIIVDRSSLLLAEDDDFKASL